MIDRGARTLLDFFGPVKLRIGWVLLTAWLAAFGTVTIAWSLHWPLVHDGPVLIYMGFLTDHGMRLYRNVVEVQFPGSVMLYSIGRHVFGPSDFGFRMFDLFGLAVALAAMMAISRRPGYWFAGVFGFAFFLLLHTGTGGAIYNLGQRDFFMTCLLGSGIAILIAAMRREQPSLMVGFGLCVSMAASMKPTALVFLLPVVLVVLEMRSRRRQSRTYVGWSAVGVAAGALLVMGYLLGEKAFGAFIQVEKWYMPLYVGIAHKNFREMVPLLAAGRTIPMLAVIALGLFAMQRWLWKDREQQV